MRAVFKLALVNAYDEDGRIRNSKGEFIPNTNLVDLLVLAMTPKKDTHGIDEFVDRLAEANVDPEWFLNEHVKRLLFEKTKGHQPSDPKVVRPTTLNPITSGAYWGPEKAKQRKLASFTKPPLSDTPPTSPPSPFKKNMSDAFIDAPEIDRMDVPPASPPKEIPTLERMDNLPPMPSLRRMDTVPKSRFTNSSLPPPLQRMPQKRRLARNVVDDDDDEPTEPKRSRLDANKSDDDWIPPPPDDSNDDW